MTTTIEQSTGNGTELAARAPAAIQRTVVEDAGQFANLLDTAKFEHMWRVAKVFSASAMVPQAFQGRPEDCFVAIQMAVRLGVDPFMFLQNTYLVGGRPGMEAKLAIALINSSGLFAGPLRFDLSGAGDARGCEAYAAEKQSGQEVRGPRVTIAMAKAEGWFGRNQSKWKTIPDLMLQYRAGAWFGRLYCPERLMGMQTVDEVRDAQADDAPRGEPTQRGVAGLMKHITNRPVSEGQTFEPAPEAVEEAAAIDGPAVEDQQHPDPDTSASEAEHRESDGGDALAAEAAEQELQYALAGDWSHAAAMMADAAEKAGMARSDAVKAIATHVRVVHGLKGKEDKFAPQARRHLYDACTEGRLTLSGAVTPKQ